MHRAVIVLVFVLFVSLLASHIFLDVGASFRKARDGQCLIDMLRHTHSVGLEVLELHLNQIAGRDTTLVRLVLVIQLGVDGKNVLFQFFVANVLKLQGLDGIGEEAARALEHRVRIPFQLDEFRIRKHFHQRLHASRMRRILAQELGPVRIPEGNLNQTHESIHEDPPLLLRDIVKQ